MINDFRICKIIEGIPNQMDNVIPDKEFKLEDWIENDPNILQIGLTIVGRQVHTSAGSIDLLGIDMEDRLVIIELKKNMLKQEVYSQVSSYAIAINEMVENDLKNLIISKAKKYSNNELDEKINAVIQNREEGNREIVIFLAGLSLDPRLPKLIENSKLSFKSRFNIVTFQLNKDKKNSLFISRNLTELDTYTDQPIPNQQEIFAKLEDAFEDIKLREILERSLEIGNKYKLKRRFYPFSVVYSPPNRGGISLFTIFANQNYKGIKPGFALVWIAAEVFEKWMNINEQQLRMGLEIGDLDLSKITLWNKDELVTFLTNMDKLLGQLSIDLDSNEFDMY